MTLTTLVLFIALAVAAVLGGTAANEQAAQTHRDPITAVVAQMRDTLSEQSAGETPAE